jgi:hypothetical protein
MARPPSRGKTRSRILLIWGTVSTAAVALAAFLAWYGTIRGNVPLIVCDTLAVIGQSDAISHCQPSGADLGVSLKQLKFLEKHKDELSPENLNQLR